MKKGFTLVEVMVSIVLLGLISMFVSSTIVQIKSNNRVFEAQAKDNSKLEKILDTLYKDIYQSKSISVDTQKRYSTLHVESKNSLYGISEPHIVWLVLKKNSTLVRLESAKKITLPIKKEFEKYIFIDKAIENCHDFSINLSKKKDSVLVFVDIEGRTNTLFEIKLLR